MRKRPFHVWRNRSEWGAPAQGVRCVKFVDRRSFAWYGEGRWGSTVYRNLGYAIGPLEVVTAPANEFTGSAADFNGNGESTSGDFPGNLQISIPNPPTQAAWDETIAPQRIIVGGAWNETWVFRPS